MVYGKSQRGVKTLDAVRMLIKLKLWKVNIGALDRAGSMWRSSRLGKES